MQSLRDPGSYIDQNNPNAALGDLYFRGSGTSEAAAYVTGAVALLLQKYPDLTPDQVKQMLVASANRLHGFSPLWQGSGELDLGDLLSQRVPRGHGWWAPHGPSSSGIGSLELSRGSDHLSMNGVELQGEQDIFGQPFDSAAMAALEAAGDSWSDGIWNGSSWSGSSWSGSSWSGSSWIELERLVVVEQFVERFLVVGKLVEWLELEWLELERQQLVERVMARSELGLTRVAKEARDRRSAVH